MTLRDGDPNSIDSARHGHSYRDGLVAGDGRCVLTALVATAPTAGGYSGRDLGRAGLPLQPVGLGSVVEQLGRSRSLADGARPARSGHSPLLIGRTAATVPTCTHRLAGSCPC